jgi:hypothetical protein
LIDLRIQARVQDAHGYGNKEEQTHKNYDLHSQLVSMVSYYEPHESAIYGQTFLGSERIQRIHIITRNASGPIPIISCIYKLRTVFPAHRNGGAPAMTLLNALSGYRWDGQVRQTPIKRFFNA